MRTREGGGPKSRKICGRPLCMVPWAKRHSTKAAEPRRREGRTRRTRTLESERGESVEHAVWSVVCFRGVKGGLRWQMAVWMTSCIRLRFFMTLFSEGMLSQSVVMVILTVLRSYVAVASNDRLRRPPRVPSVPVPVLASPPHDQITHSRLTKRTNLGVR